MKRLLPLLLLLFASPAWGQIALDGTTTTDSNTTGTTCSFAHTTGAGSNRLLVARVYLHDATGLGTPTYNAVSTTSAISISNASSNDTVAIYYLIAPASGANTFTASWSNNSAYACAVSTYTGAHQTTVLRDANSGNGLTTGPPTANLTGVSADDLLVDIAAFGSSAGETTGVTLLAVNSGQTSDFNLDLANDAANIAGSHDTGSGTVAMTWTFGAEQGSQYWEIATAAFIQAAVSPPATVRQRQVMILP
jgi:hypothetical protein